jgi:hypothetical protein
LAATATQTVQGWSTEQWNDGLDSLRDREIVDADGALTEHGNDLRELVEDITNDLALAPWAALGEEGAARLVELAKPWRDTVIDQGVFPNGVFNKK